MPIMPASQRKFFESPEAKELKAILKRMVNDDSFNTDPTYISNGLKYPGNNISFVDKHLLYLSHHPKLDPQHYIANLKLMTRHRK